MNDARTEDAQWTGQVGEGASSLMAKGSRYHRVERLSRRPSIVRALRDNGPLASGWSLRSRLTPVWWLAPEVRPRPAPRRECAVQFWKNDPLCHRGHHPSDSGQITRGRSFDDVAPHCAEMGRVPATQHGGGRRGGCEMRKQTTESWRSDQEAIGSDFLPGAADATRRRGIRGLSKRRPDGQWSWERGQQCFCWVVGPKYRWYLAHQRLGWLFKRH